MGHLHLKLIVLKYWIHNTFGYYLFVQVKLFQHILYSYALNLLYSNSYFYLFLLTSLTYKSNHFIFYPILRSLSALGDDIR